jgi:hypothetical protein
MRHTVQRRHPELVEGSAPDKLPRHLNGPHLSEADPSTRDRHPPSPFLSFYILTT